MALTEQLKVMSMMNTLIEENAPDPRELMEKHHSMRDRSHMQYLALVSVSKDLEKLKKIMSETDVDNLTETERFLYWTMVEDTLRQCAKKLEESRSPTDDEMLEMAKEDRPISRGELGLQMHPPRVLME